MDRPFDAAGTRIRVRVDVQERQLLARLLDEVGELLDDGRHPSDDPLAELVGFDLRFPDEQPSDGRDLDDLPLVDPDSAGPAGDDDPALVRLLPQGHRDDPDLAAEFRRLTEAGLRARKRAHLALASAALQRAGQVELSQQEASALLKGLTDIRLVLGERLGLRTDEDADRITQAVHGQITADDPWVSAAMLYDILTWWQESLVAAMSGQTAIG